jgi:hypothetical protein
MFDQPVAADMSPPVAVEIVFPDEGIIRVASRTIAEPDASICRCFGPGITYYGASKWCRTSALPASSRPNGGN